MYRDIHRMLGDKQFIENPASVVVHFVRELKSSIEKVLLPADFVRPRERGDAAAIAAILKNLGLPEDHAVGKIWNELEPHKIVHRRALGRPLTIEQVRGKVADFENMLGMLLEELERSFVAIYAKVDALLAKPQPGKDDVSTLRNEIPQNTGALGYFYAKAPVDRWLDPLQKKDVFADEPLYAPWPALHFLMRAAETDPARVGEILGSMPLPAVSLHQMQYLDIIARLPLGQQGSLLQRTAESSDRPLEGYVARGLGTAVKRIASTEPESALAITRRLLTLHAHDAQPSSLRDLHADFDVSTYGFIAKDVAPNVIALHPGNALFAFEDLLDTALDEGCAGSRENDISVIWRPSIVPHAQNRFFKPVEYLGEAVRLAAEAAVQVDAEGLTQIVERLHARKWTFFRRLAIHLVTTFADPAGQLARDEILRDTNLQDRSCRREYHLLVSKVFSHLSDGEQRGWINRVLEGPQAEEFKRLGDRSHAEEYSDEWIKNHLAWIEGTLSGDVRHRYEDLVARHGGYEQRTDFSTWMTEWRGPTSPIPTDQLGAMSLEDLVRYLAEWEPQQQSHFVPTREGLGRDLQTIAKTRADEFSVHATRFIEIDATYVRSMLAGLEAAVKEEGHINWEETLTLCAWVVAQQRLISDRDHRGLDNDPHWGWARSAIASLLQAGFTSKKANTPSHELRERIWAVLEPLTADPEPDAERAEQLRDPMSVAINSTRGIAMEAVMRYIEWVRGGVQRPQGIDSFEDLAEVRAVLDTHLDPLVDSSPAIRAVYGQWLFFLHEFAPAWVKVNIDRLFPATDSELEDVALDSYAVFGQYTSEAVRKLLDPVYRRVLNRWHVQEGAQRTERDSLSHIGQQFILGYLHGEETLDPGSLLSLFFDRADIATRADILAFAVQQMKDRDNHDAGYEERCIALWEARAATGDAGELRAFGRWVAEEALDPAWRLAHLEQALASAGGLDYEFDLMPTLARLAPTFGAAVIRCTKLAIEAADYWRMYAYVHENDMRRLLEACLASDERAVRNEARAVANMLVARDLLDFRDVAEMTLPLDSPAIEEAAGECRALRDNDR
jgi:hypothetical protein